MRAIGYYPQPQMQDFRASPLSFNRTTTELIFCPRWFISVGLCPAVSANPTKLSPMEGTTAYTTPHCQTPAQPHSHR